MMSLQVIALCYIVMMLVVPTTVYLLMTLKRGNKVEEVKIQEQKRSFSTPTLQHWADAYEPCDGYWSSLYEEMCNRQNARAAGCTIEELCFCGYQAKNPDLGDGSRCARCHKRHEDYLATREAILSLQGADIQMDWDGYKEEKDECTLPDNSCEEEAYSEEECEEDEGEDQDDNQATREQEEKDAHYADLQEEEEAFWYQDIEDALSVCRKTFVPKFSKRKTCFGKDRRENGRKHKYQWRVKG